MRGDKNGSESGEPEKDFSSPLKKLFYIIIRYPVEKYAQCRFDRMRNRYLKMTKRCTTPEDLSQLKADAFMTGVTKCGDRS